MQIHCKSGWNEDKNPEDKNGRTPLHMAAYNQNGAIYEFITELAEKKPEVHCSRNVGPTIPLFSLVFSNARTS